MNNTKLHKRNELNITISSLIVLVVMGFAAQIAEAKVISFQEQYQDYLGNWHPYTSANINTYPFYSWVDTGSNYTVTRIDDGITLPKANTVYNFDPNKISFTFNFTPSQLNSRSVSDGANWYITIPTPTTQLRFGWDNLKPTVTNNTGYVIPDINFWYSKANGQVRFYYNPTARNIGASSTYIIFTFNSFTINNATTSGFTTSNISLNGSRWTDDGELALNNRNDSALNMTNLTAYWSADETIGTTWHQVNNESGLINTTNQGTWHGNTTLNYTSGVIGNAGIFDGIDDYIDAGSDSSLNPPNITISMWFKTTLTGDTIAGNRMAGAPFSGYQVSVGASSPHKFEFWVGGSSWTSGTTTVDDGNWYFGTAVYNGTNTSVYINGKLEKTQTQTAVISSPTNFFIGKYIGGGDWGGSIDEFRVWSRALSASEIAVLYNTSMRTQAMPIIYQQNASSIGHVINRTRVVYSGQDSINNASIYARQNGTSAWTLIQSNATSNTWYTITNQFNSTDFGVYLQGNGSNTTFFTSLEWDETNLEYTPPSPINITSTNGSFNNGSFWINTTWEAGAGNITDSYNVSVNGIWTNGTTSNFTNSTVLASGFQNVIVFAFNNTGHGTLNSTGISLNTQAPAAPVTNHIYSCGTFINSIVVLLAILFIGVGGGLAIGFAIAIWKHEDLNLLFRGIFIYIFMVILLLVGVAIVLFIANKAGC